MKNIFNEKLLNENEVTRVTAKKCAQIIIGFRSTRNGNLEDLSEKEKHRLEYSYEFLDRLFRKYGLAMHTAGEYEDVIRSIAN